MGSSMPSTTDSPRHAAGNRPTLGRRRLSDRTDTVGLMLIAFSVAPSGTGELSGAGPTDSVSAAVTEAVRIVRESGLPNRTDSMFTTIEGDWDEVFDVVKRAADAVGAFGTRVSLVLKADIRPGFTGELTGKLDRLENALEAARAQ
jgi:uncharacterized protein YqgV (UPF0045/DUF77 family)